ALAGLGAFVDLDLGARALKGGHFEFAAECRCDHRDGNFRVKIGPVAGKELVGLDRDEDVEIAGRSAAHAGFALAAQPYAGAVLDALGNIDRKRARDLPPSLAVAIGAGLVHGLPAPVALGTGLLDGEEPLRGAHLAVAGAHAAGGKAGARLGAR